MARPFDRCLSPTFYQFMMKVLLLWAIAILPGLTFTLVSAYFLFVDWTALDVNFRRYQELATSSSATEITLMVAGAAELRHRINAFADGVGVRLGNILLAIGVHGLCTMPSRKQTSMR